MKVKYIPLILMVLSLTSCGKEVLTFPSPSPQGSIPVQPSQMEPAIDMIDTANFSLTYDQNVWSIRDLSSDLEEDNLFYNIRPASIAGESDAFAHCDLFSGNRVEDLDQYTQDEWEQQSKILALSYYKSSDNVKISNEHTSMDGEKLRTTVKITATDSIPETISRITLQNGTTGCLISIVMSYADDTTTPNAMMELVKSIQIK